MQTGIPKKVEIFQDFYYETYNRQLSYSEAADLYLQMDADMKAAFEQFYQDETGYELVGPSGYNLTPDSSSSSNGTYQEYDWKFNATTNKYEYVLVTRTSYTSNLAQTKNVYNQIKYTLDAYAKENGLVLDPQWAGYSAEEIIQMENEGVNIPQEVLDIAHTIYDQQKAEEAALGEGEEDETTEKDPFLDLIPKAVKKIKKCNETSEKIDDEIEEILPEAKKQEQSFKDKIKDQKDSLEEYEDFIREWRRLQNKINNGEALSSSEAKRYAQITGYLEDKNTNSDAYEIAKHLNDINILAILGEKLADETIEIGDNLADYTSKSNFKATYKEAKSEIGFIAAIFAMIAGKALAKEANEVGNETKDYAEESSRSVMEIANILEIESAIASPTTTPETEETLEQPTPEEEVVIEETQTEGAPEEAAPDEELDAENVENIEAQEQIDAPQTTPEEDFIINDKNVLDLIDKANEVTEDLTKQVFIAMKHMKIANKDSKFAKIAGKRIERLVKFHEQAKQEREQEKATLEKENKELIDEIVDLTGKTEDEVKEEIDNTQEGQNNNSNDNKKEVNGIEVEAQLSEEDKQKVKENKNKIKNNNVRIEELIAEQEKADALFKTAVSRDSKQIEKSIPEEMKNQEDDTKYKEEIIPAGKEHLEFTDASGETLFKMGTYRVTVGIEQIANMQIRRGTKNVIKGTISAGIGVGAMAVGSNPIPETAEKATDSALKFETKAITDLTELDTKIASITGESVVEKEEEQQKQEEQQESSNNEAVADVTTTNTEENTFTETTETTINPATETANMMSAEAPEIALTATEPTIADTTNPEDVVVTPETAGEMVADEVPAQAQTLAINAGTETAESNENPNEEGTPVGQVQNKPTTTTSSAKKDEEEEMDTDQAGSSVASITGSAKDDSKDSEKVLKDTEKDEKQLQKETKQLQKQMKKDEKEVVKMTKESMKSAQKQAVILAEYETLSAENETLIAQEEAKSQGLMVDGQFGKSNDTQTQSNMQISGPVESENTAKLEMNDGRITQLGIEFTMHGKKIDRNSAKIKRIQKRTKTNRKKFNKKTEIRMDKIKEAEKKEQAKQKRLAKQLGVVGIAENVFSITMSTGAIMMLFPPTAAAGEIIFNIGLYGVLACGVAKATINAANGNWTAALIGLGTTAVTAALSFTGAGASAGTVLNAVSSGLSIVSNSAQLVNNVRAVQGKEANGTFGMIGTIAGAASAIVGVAGSFANSTKTLADGTQQVVKSAFSQAGSLGKVAIVASAVGTVLSQTSNLMTEFGAGGKTADLLGMIGGAISTAASLTQLGIAKFGNNNDSKDQGSDQGGEQGGTQGNDQGATVKGDKLIGPDGKEIPIPEGCKIKDGKVVDANGKEVQVGADGKVKTETAVDQNVDRQSSQIEGNAENPTLATVNDGKLVDANGNTVQLPEGCRIEGNKIVDSTGAEVKISTSGEVVQTTYAEGSTVQGNKIFDKNGNEVKLPEGYKVEGNQVIGPNGEPVRLDANGKVLKADHQAQIEAAKNAQKRQETLAEGTTNEKEKQEILNGSSERYAGKTDEQLQMEQLKNIANSEGIHIGNELTQRNQYRDQMAFLDGVEADKFDWLSLGDVAGSFASSFMQGGQQQVTQTKKPAEYERNDELLRRLRKKRDRRVNALQQMYA